MPGPIHRVARAFLCLALLAAALPKSAHAMSRLPKRMDRELLCDACGATLVELDEMITKTEKKLGRETAISEALESVCDNVYTFTRYTFPPPRMQKGCVAIVEALEEELESALSARVSPEDAARAVCADACEGVDQKAKPAGTVVEEAYVDGVPYDGTKDGEL